MKKFGFIVCLALFGCTLTAATPSSKSAVQISTTVTSCGSFGNNQCLNTDGSARWMPVMRSEIKTNNVADLFVGVSLVTGIYTSTSVKGNSTGATSSAVAEGTVRVRVLVDPADAACQDDCASLKSAPDGNRGIVFDQRIQSLSANLGFIFTGDCAASPTTCTLTPEEITLVLDTTAAHSFNFALTNVGVGTHRLVVQAQVSTANTSPFSTTNGGVAISNALFGLGSLTVNAVRLVNSFNCAADASGTISCS